MGRGVRGSRYSEIQQICGLFARKYLGSARRKVLAVGVRRSCPLSTSVFTTKNSKMCKMIGVSVY